MLNWENKKKKNTNACIFAIMVLLKKQNYSIVPHTNVAVMVYQISF
jgi:hypothetical protein